MSDAPSFRLLPHEWVFGAFLAATGLGLAFVAGPFARDTLVFSAIFAAAVALVVGCPAESGLGWWRVRLAFYPVAMNVAYFALRTAGPALNPRLYDDALQAADRFLLGGNVSVWLQRFTHPVLTEVLSFCYVIFFRTCCSPG